VHARTMVVSVVAMSMLALAGCASHPPSGGSATTRPKPKPQFSDSYSLVVEPDVGAPGLDGTDGYIPIYRLITSARKTVDMTVYRLLDPTILADLEADAKRGVNVRIILDASGDELQENGGAYGDLLAHGVHVVWSSTAYADTHQTTITVDDSTSAIMTAVLDTWSYTIARDFTIMDSDKADVNAIETVFAADYAHTPVTPSDADHLVWSPTGSEQRLLALINGATHTLSVENREMKDPAITSALIRAAKRGVDVKVTLNDYTSKQLTNGGVHVKMYTSDESVLDLNANVIVADGSTMFIGSETFSNASLTMSRELGFMTTNPAMISTVTSALATDFAGTTKLEPWRP
jgi:phosphatidylserine/phosphatidylglycerophosphate/cardiolipin synthase-like enzyme